MFYSTLRQSSFCHYLDHTAVKGRAHAFCLCHSRFLSFIYFTISWFIYVLTPSFALNVCSTLSTQASRKTWWKQISANSPENLTLIIFLLSLWLLSGILASDALRKWNLKGPAMPFSQKTSNAWRLTVLMLSQYKEDLNIYWKKCFFKKVSFLCQEYWSVVVGVNLGKIWCWWISLEAEKKQYGPN